MREYVHREDRDVPHQRRVRMRWVALSLIALGGCSTTPPQPPTPRMATAVGAPFGKTWDAVISIFADQNISIKTLDRSSGLVVAEPQSLVGAQSREDGLADCGKTLFGQGYYASFATWNVLVHGDSTQSTIKATVRFMTQAPTNLYGNAVGAGTECSSTGKWETAFEQRVKAAAEGKTASR